jgi:lysophospholipase L1-like esterase
MQARVKLFTSIISQPWPMNEMVYEKDLGDDGVHPNLEGYKIMAPLAEKAIAEALQKQ